MSARSRAFLLAPLAAPLAYWVILVLEGIALRPASLSAIELGQFLGLAFLFGTPIAYAATIAGGVPAYVILRRLRLLTLPVIALTGAGIGIATGEILAPQLRGDLFSIPLGPWRAALCGACAAGAWCKLDRSRHASAG